MARNEAFREAEKKIQRAQRTGAVRLDLSWKYGRTGPPQLSALPASVGPLSEFPQSLGDLTHLQSLDLSGNKLRALPEFLSNLTHLQSLDLSDNQLTALPEWLGQLPNLQKLNLSLNPLRILPVFLEQLTQLQELDVTQTGLAALPESMRHLKELRTLWLFGNDLMIVPPWIGDLISLQYLGVTRNPIKTLPQSLSSLKDMKRIYLGDSVGGCSIGVLPTCIREWKQLELIWALNCELENLPEWVGELENLEELLLACNHLKNLPLSLCGLSKLNRLDVSDNPLNPGLAAAYREGTSVVKRYLRELAKGGKARYEAKLFILGDGNEGKTCVSRALRGLPFAEQTTTHGVDVEQWMFPHPNHTEEEEKNITLNIWDFEGQEISHQTHQFFLTSQSLYLLVFKCRDQFLLDRAEYWLDTIRARAPQAKVAIVVTQCEERTPHVPLDRLQAQYGDLFTDPEWFFPVGCKNPQTIENLQVFLQRWSADMEFMGSLWPTSYSGAETQIKAKAQAKRRGASITRNSLNRILRKAGVDKSNLDEAAAAMSRLGVITQFPDCPDLRDFVVLRPQWLTKAISKVMEDGQLSEHKGEITLQRMTEIWQDSGYSGMFATFHDCMKEFELCYDLDDAPHTCLVPLRFGYVKPNIPWTLGEESKERRVEYKLNIRPPMGLMSRFIVKTHHMIVKTPEHPKGVYWHNGVFLRTGEGPFTSEALCEFDAEERKFRIQVRAAFPQNLTEQIHGYIKAVFSFFEGLDAERSYGCIKAGEQIKDETPCKGIHEEAAIYFEIQQERKLSCHIGLHLVDPRTLISGFSSFGDSDVIRRIMREEADKQPKWADPLMNRLDSLSQWIAENHHVLEQILTGQEQIVPAFQQELQLKLNDYLGAFDELLDDRDFTSAPGIVSIHTQSRSRWNPTSYFTETFILTPYCECVGAPHPCDDGQVTFTRDKAWWEKSAPWVSRGTKLLASGLLLAFTGVPAVDPSVFEGIKEDVDFMKELAKHLELKEGDKHSKKDDFIQGDRDLRLNEKNPETRLLRESLRDLLEDVAGQNYKARQWGSLRRVKLSDNTHRWLCPEHAAKV